MAQHYPTNERVDFLACESVRAEAGGKLTMLGYYPGSSINISTSTTLPAQIQLALVYVLRDGEGKFNCKLRIGLPTHKSGQDIDLPEINKDRNKNHTVTINFVAFPVPEAGEYRFVLILDDEIYERILRIEIRDYENPS